MAPGPIGVVLVPIPEADLLVRPWTRPLGLGAHVTLVAPLLGPERIDADAAERLAAGLVGVAAFEVTFDRVQWFSDTVVYLAPRDPHPFDRLARRVGEALPDFVRSTRPFVAHLTLAKRRSPDELARAAAAGARAVPLSARARSVRIVAQRREGGWEERVRVDLATPATSH